LINIDSKIVSVSVVEKVVTKTVDFKLADRTEILDGRTYKVKSPLSEYSLYITINNIEKDGRLYPFEIFINSKSMEHVQWTVALTRLISSVFRQSISSGADIRFIVKELKSVFDSNGGYRKSKGIIIPSLVAEIGYVIERHLTSIGLLESLENLPSTHIDTKNLRQCPECGSISVYRESGCDMCTNCSYSKCG